jgi:hypothetical protein
MKNIAFICSRHYFENVLKIGKIEGAKFFVKERQVQIGDCMYHQVSRPIDILGKVFDSVSVAPDSANISKCLDMICERNRIEKTFVVFDMYAELHGESK